MLIINRNKEEVIEFVPTPEQAFDMYKKKAGFVNTDVITIIENYYDFLVTNSLFYKIDVAYLVISDKSTSADNLAQYKINAINPRRFALRYYNNPTADKIGVQWSSASQQYASTGFVPSKYRPSRRMSLNQACGGIYQVTNAGNSVDFGTNPKSGTNPSFAMSSNLGTDLYDAINGPISGDGTALSSLGFNTMVREASNQFFVRHNGAAYKTYTNASSGFPNLPILIGALGPISNGLFSNNKFCHMFLGGMNVAEVTTYETYVNTMQGNIETALGLSAGIEKNINMEYYILTLEEALKLRDTNVSGIFINPIAFKTGEYGVPKNMDSLFPFLKDRPLKNYDSSKLPDGYISIGVDNYKIDHTGKRTKAEKVYNPLYTEEEKEAIRIKDEEKKKQDSKFKK